MAARAIVVPSAKTKKDLPTSYACGESLPTDPRIGRGSWMDEVISDRRDYQDGYGGQPEGKSPTQLHRRSTGSRWIAKVYFPSLTSPTSTADTLYIALVGR